MKQIYQDIQVFGKVQGVYFRKSTQEKAIELSIKGYVENLQDGSVHIEAEGSQAQMDQFIEWCYIGSIMSKVQKISIKSGDLKGFEGFKIKR